MFLEFEAQFHHFNGKLLKWGPKNKWDHKEIILTKSFELDIIR